MLYRIFGIPGMKKTQLQMQHSKIDIGSVLIHASYFAFANLWDTSLQFVTFHIALT